MGYPHPDLKKRRLKRLQKEQVDTLNKDSYIRNKSAINNKAIIPANESLIDTKPADKKQEDGMRVSNKSENIDSRKCVKKTLTNTLSIRDERCIDKDATSNEQLISSEVNTSSLQCEARNKGSVGQKNSW